jgi:hypothetical protein
MNIYPESELIYETDHRVDGNHAVQSYYYVTDDPLEEVAAYYVDAHEPNVLVGDQAAEWFGDFNDFSHIKRYGGGNVISAHEAVCAQQLSYADCITTLLISLRDGDVGETLIIFNYWITFL